MSEYCLRQKYLTTEESELLEEIYKLKTEEKE